jgi:hypothetical protein
MSSTRILLCGLLIFFLHAAPVQGQTFQWLNRVGGPSYDPAANRPDEIVNDIATDAQGNVYICGRVRNLSNINGHALNTYGGNDIFVAKLDCSGNLVWVKVAGSQVGERDHGNSLVLDGLGHIYITGWISGQDDPGGPFDSPIHFFDTIYHMSTQSMFLAKLDTSGNFIWGRIGQTVAIGEKVVIDADGKVNVLMGSYEGGELFPGLNVVTAFYVARFDTSGNVERMLQVTGEPRLIFQDFKMTDDNEFYLIGHSSWDSVTVGGVTLYRISPQNSYDFYCFKLDTSGIAQWYLHFGFHQFSFSFGYGCALDGNGDLLITGAAYDGLVLGNDTLRNSISSGFGTDFAFVAKLNPQGQVLWARNINANSVARSSGGIAVKSNGHAVISGFFVDTMIIGSDTVTGSGSNKLFVAEFSDNGTILGGESVPTVNGGNDTEASRTVCDAEDNVLFAGAFSGNLIVDGTLVAYAGGYTDGFLIKWGNSLCTVGIDENFLQTTSSLIVYPNPASDRIRFKFTEALSLESSLIIVDAMGREVKKGIIAAYTDEQELDVSGLSSGLYYYRLQNARLAMSGKFILESVD